MLQKVEKNENLQTRQPHRLNLESKGLEVDKPCDEEIRHFEFATVFQHYLFVHQSCFSMFRKTL